MQYILIHDYVLYNLVILSVDNISGQGNVDRYKGVHDLYTPLVWAARVTRFCCLHCEGFRNFKGFAPTFPEMLFIE